MRVAPERSTADSVAVVVELVEEVVLDSVFVDDSVLVDELLSVSVELDDSVVDEVEVEAGFRRSISAWILLITRVRADCIRSTNPG